MYFSRHVHLQTLLSRGRTSWRRPFIAGRAVYVFHTSPCLLSTHLRWSEGTVPGILPVNGKIRSILADEIKAAVSFSNKYGCIYTVHVAQRRHTHQSRATTGVYGKIHSNQVRFTFLRMRTCSANACQERQDGRYLYATVAASFLHNEANDEVNDKHMTDKFLLMLLSAPEAWFKLLFAFFEAVLLFKTLLWCSIFSDQKTVDFLTAIG